MSLIVIIAGIIFVLLFAGMIVSVVLCNGMNRDQEAEDEEQMKYIKSHIKSLKKKRKA